MERAARRTGRGGRGASWPMSRPVHERWTRGFIARGVAWKTASPRLLGGGPFIGFFEMFMIR